MRICCRKPVKWAVINEPVTSCTPHQFPPATRCNTASPVEHQGFPEVQLLFKLLSKRQKDRARNVFAILLAERLFMGVPSAQVIKVWAIRGPRGGLQAAQDGRCVQRDSRGFKMVSSINENPTLLSGSHLMEGFVWGICRILKLTKEPLAQQSLILPSIVSPHTLLYSESL